ncbi:hypothetical protein H6G33_09240 [Calothrix sp. FACHB-1219]|uniref:hypothetical protein n=1 Tax=unclassified Calothrix TaxID=2619626 RepID=UPI001687D82D|nr:MULTISPECIES: hypothetical protein [unclassified Calothrix]MBD2201529.1 hypothetical protein [Calothrix sp. FACHB-168]MBD2217215.1 hypothetical protein [Calothrix sp. FACHB-1219]
MDYTNFLPPNAHVDPETGALIFNNPPKEDVLSLIARIEELTNKLHSLEQSINLIINSNQSNLD